MGAQPADLVARFGVYFGNEIRVVLRIHRAGEHEVLPDQQTETVTFRVEEIVLVHPAAPYAQHGHVAFASPLQQRGVTFGFDCADERITRDPVRTFGENGHAVQDEAEEARPPLAWIRRLIEDKRTDPNAPTILGERRRPVQERDRELVQRWLAQIMRPPQLRLVEGQVGAPV
jgi:hypothetical protein